MEDIAISIASKIAEYLVKPLLQHAHYMFSFNKIVRNLHNHKDRLILTQRSVNERKKEAKRKTEKIEDIVEKWMDDVSNVLVEVEKIEEKTKEKSRCYRGPFQYLLAKEVARLTEKMSKLNSYKLDPFSRRTELPGMKYFSSKNFVYSKSTKDAYNKLMEALKDGSNGMIGLLGMGGAGKSTLVTQVGKEAEEMHLFDKVVMAIVSHNSQVTNIQGQIADSLDLILREETPIGRAQRLSTSLQNERTLVILDDVWEKLNLEAIGIPPCCTVLLTTRRRDICVSMNCQVTVELNLMDDEDAWTLFQQCADIIDDSKYASRLKDVPRKIAKKCKGLPIAIVAMASMLRRKNIEEWELALIKLEEYVEEELPSSSYACIKLSYDNLTENVSKFIFLLCSMFPEDREINVEDLVRYSMGLGLVAGRMEKVRKEIQVAIHSLKDSYLLEPSDQNEFVKMHDLVRDVALWIASKEGKVTTKTLAVENENMKKLTALSLWGMDNHPPIDHLQCPKLKTLLLHSVDGSSFQVPNMYFGGMQMLEVLGIIKFYYTWRNLYTLRNLSSSLSMLKIHQSIEKLTMLRSLSLRGYELGDISALASLTRLEVLDMRNSSFNELPQGIGALKKLRLLDIYTCRIKKNNPYEVIRKCVHLEELYAWPVEDDSFHIVSLPMLHRYVIVCDKFRENCRFLIDAYLEDHVPSRALCIDRYDAAALIHESSSIKNLFERAEHLYLGHLRGGCKNIIPHMDQGGMTKVIGLILESCSDIECLLDNDSGTNLPAFSDLVTLKLIRMDGLKEVFRDPTSQCSLKNLEDLQIEYCVQLNSISFPRNSNMCNLKILRLQWCPMLTSSLFTPAVARGLELLEELKLFDCSNLKHIIDEEYEEDGNASTLKVFPNLRILHVHGCQRLGSIFPVAFAQNLERLEKIAIWYNFGLKYVFGTHNDYKGNGNEAKANVNLHALRRISLVSLSNMINICPKYCHPRSPNLKEIEYKDCPDMPIDVMCKTMISSDMQQGLIATEEKIVFPENRESVQALECLAIEHSMVEGIFQLQAAEASPLSSNLSHLYLKDLPDLRLIWKCPKDLLSLRKLKSLVLSECKNLETIFSSTIIGCLAELRELVASKCEKLEQIIYSDLAEQVGNASACSNSVCLPLLSVVHVFQCKNLKCLFSHSLASPFPELEFITVEECASIEHVFYFTEDDRGQEVGQVPDQDRQQLLLPKLRELKLICLPNFTEICQGPYKLQKNVKHYTVRHCPKYTDAWLQTENQENNQISSTLSQTNGKVPSSTSASAAAATTGGGASDPQIQKRESNLEINLESERKRRRLMEFEERRQRLMELDLQVERERRRLLELRLEAEQERRKIMEDALLLVFHEMLGSVPQQFASMLSQTQLAPNEESEDQDFRYVSIEFS
ncbi:disease resistance protein At4g27190 [Cajanus cajan]|uniref:disease resistance protein At4g27190 n=1 Tax=Cajanus cajan TaxID=3821 RepID=UPI00098DC882|nr:disease resistance protein At4g27190 [Cajanus cajan]